MPCPHFDAAIYSRKYGSGRGKNAEAKKLAAEKRPGGFSVIASVAYQSGEKLRDEERGVTFDFRDSRSRRQDDVRHVEILTPEGAPGWTKDRAELWRKVEQSESRRDAQLARDIIGALPRELTLEQNIALVRSFAKEHFTDKGMIVDLAIHESMAGDQLPQPHVHMLVTLRNAEAEGFSKNKNREWNQWNAQRQKAESVEPMRAAWEAHTNVFLAAAGRTERVNLGTNRDQGIDKTPELHLGYKAGNLEKQGEETRRGNQNRDIRHKNRTRERAKGLLAQENEAVKTPELLERTGRTASERGAPEPENLREAAQQLKPQETDGMDGAAELRHRAMQERYLQNSLPQPVGVQARFLQRVEEFMERGREFSQGVLARFSLYRSNREIEEDLRRIRGERDHER